MLAEVRGVKIRRPVQLTPGTRFGSYEVQSYIGAGGMGEVYRALDIELHRVVALKVLPDQFVRDVERVSRFEREATTLASLNHPQVAQIYGIVHGADESRALAMEFVDGEDLAARIRRGPLALDDALSIARQIASALEAAHECGIVHRDLKPANIMVRSDEVVKVLDFGLARIVHPELSPSGNPDSPTITSPAMTERGIILGTAAYMSPEQANGRAVDRRTDIWAFGCVLLEMLTGQRPFKGDTVAELTTSVLRDTPNWDRLPPSTPTAVRKLLKRCLEKERTRRLDSAAAVRLDLEEVIAGAAEPLAERPGPAAGRRERVAWVVASVSAVVAIAAIVVALWVTRQPPASEARLDITTPPTGNPYSFAMAPDGSRVVFVAGGYDSPLQLWLRSIENPSAAPIPGTEGAVYPFWSPDSRSIGFFANGKLQRVDLDAGVAARLADAPAGRGGSWGVNGQILFTQNASSSIMVVSSSGSDLRAVTTLASGEGGHLHPVWHPDGRRFFFYLSSGDPERRGVYVAAVDQPGKTRIVASDGSAQLRRSGDLVYVRDTTLYVQAFDNATNTVTGTPTALAYPISSSFGRSAFSISESGPLAYRTGRIRGNQLRWFTRDGAEGDAFAEPDVATQSGPVLSPSGARVAINRTVQGNQDIWVLDQARGAPARLTVNPAPDVLPVWSPDESAIAFRSNRGNTLDIYTTAATAEGGDTLLLKASALGESTTNVSASDWSRDGRWLLLWVVYQTESRDLWALPMDTPNRKPQLILGTRFDESNAKMSPDGRWIMYQTNESGRFEIAVRAFPTGERVWQVSRSGGFHGRWSRDGKELYFVAPDGMLMAVAADGSGGAFRAGTPVPLFAPRFAEATVNPFNAQYDVGADGRFLINMTLDEVATAPITLILNWTGGRP